MTFCFKVYNIKISLKLESPSLMYFNNTITKKLRNQKTAIFVLYILILHIYFLLRQQISYIVT